MKFEFPPRAKQESKEFNEGAVFQKILKEAELIKLDQVGDRNGSGQLSTLDGKKVSNIQNELHWKIIRTPTFKHWFGNSVVKDENGEPKVVYRASLAKSSDISDGIKFKSKSEIWDPKSRNIGVFFSSSRDGVVSWFKSSYEDHTTNYHEDDDVEGNKLFEESKKEFLEENEEQVKVASAFIKLENPFIERGYNSELNSPHVSINDFHVRSIEGGDDFWRQLNAQNDGLYIPHSSDFGDEYAVLKSKDIFILPSAI